MNRLKATHYSGTLSRVAPPFTARGLELAFREKLADVHFQLMTLARDYDLLSLYYLKQIAWDLKTVLKAKALGRDAEESMGYLTMHAEELVGRRDLIVRVLSAKDLQEVSALLKGTEFGSDIETAINLFVARKEVRLFDLYLDHAVLSAIATEYTRNGKSYAGTRTVDVAGVGEEVANDINSYNVLGVLRARLWGLPEEDVRSLVVSPPPAARMAILQSLIETESLAEAIKLVREAYPESTKQTGTDEEMIDSIETYFTTRSMRIANRSSVWQGFGLASALALIRLLEFEVKNLSAIAIGIEAHMETKNIVSRLVL